MGYLVLIVKRPFGYAKVACQGIAKNMNRFHVLFASVNSYNALAQDEQWISAVCSAP